MESDTSAHKNELGAKDMEEGDEIGKFCNSITCNLSVTQHFWFGVLSFLI